MLTDSIVELCSNVFERSNKLSQNKILQLNTYYKATLKLVYYNQERGGNIISPRVKKRWVYAKMVPIIAEKNARNKREIRYVT